MTLPAADTAITYPDGATSGTGTVLHVEPLPDGRSAVLLDVTPMHPVDTAWPDQPADRGTITVDGRTVPVVDVVTGGIQDGRLFLGADLPVRTGTDGWVFVVAHLLDGDAPDPGAVVDVQVDEPYRAALSAGHTACHLASLALDAALAPAWSKDPQRDALGNPAFDAMAIQRSQIVPDGSVDRYRIGKSLRKKGFGPAALDDPAALAARVDALLAEWVDAGGPVRIERDDDALSTRRTWVCDLPGGRAEIACGGTHVADLGGFSSITVELVRTEVDGGLELRMDTTAR